jgi:hypothetical protein
VLELRELGGAVADELELALDVAVGLGEQRPAALRVDVLAAQLGANLGTGVLGGEQFLQLLHGHAEELFQAHHLAQPLDLLVAVDAVAPGRSRRWFGEQADLLVVANRAWGRAHEPGDVADAQVLGRRGRRGGGLRLLGHLRP